MNQPRPNPSSSAPLSPAYRLNLRFLKRAIRLARPYWSSDERHTARRMLTLLILLLLGYTGFAVLFNEQTGEFTSALAARDSPRFWRSILAFFGLLVIGVPIDSYYYYVLERLALHWRRWLTERFLGRYLHHRRYYHLVGNPEIDNPDQRIADDISWFTRQSLGFLLVFANGFFQLIAFGGVLWSISRPLVLFLFVYAALLTGVTFGIFGQKMVSLHFAQRGREADFRFGLVRLRENAEAIAFYHGEHQEQQHLRKVFARLFANASDIIRWTLRLNFFYFGNNYLVLVLPTLIIAPRVLSGQLEVGRIVQAGGAFSAILAALTILLDNLEDLSRFAASVARLETFARGLSSGPAKAGEGPLPGADVGGAPAPAAEESGKIRVNEGPELAFEGFTLTTPNGERTLVKNLTASIPAGAGLMIVGESGAGKSSLLRAIAGLWDTGEGTLLRPRYEDMLFLPQHAYMAVGNLRAQLSYPNLRRPVSDEELREALKRANLPGLVERAGGFDADFDFEKILSVGERQRLALARVFLNSPKYVLLDEATSALDHENELELYEQLSRMEATLVSVSHHPDLVKYHAQVLELKAGGDWRLHAAGEFRFAEAAFGTLGASDSSPFWAT
jgi:putative ATP-binding cassette transporter